MPQTDVSALSALKKQIAAGRRKLQELYDAHGTTTPEVLAVSIELDELINEYDKKR
jgi:Spo0E like sporulation regulatory protein.